MCVHQVTFGESGTGPLLFSKLLSGTWPSMGEVLSRLETHLTDPTAYMGYCPTPVGWSDQASGSPSVGGGGFFPPSPGLRPLPRLSFGAVPAAAGGSGTGRSLKGGYGADSAGERSADKLKQGERWGCVWWGCVWWGCAWWGCAWLA